MERPDWDDHEQLFDSRASLSLTKLPLTIRKVVKDSNSSPVKRDRSTKIDDPETEQIKPFIIPLSEPPRDSLFAPCTSFADEK